MPPDDTLNTHDLWHWVEELRAGRPNAAQPIFLKILARVERLARAAMKRFPRAGRFVDTDDVVQNSVLRLLAAFRQVRPASRREFYALTNELIRRELLDVVKRFYGPRGHGTNLSGVAVGGDEGEYMPADPSPALDDLDRLAAFHEAVAKLPAEEREVVGLTYYHGWTQAEIAALFQVSVRTVQRWYEAAILQLRDTLPPDE